MDIAGKVNEFGETEWYDNGHLKYMIDVFDNKFHYNSDGKYHRLDGPAVEWDSNFAAMFSQDISNIKEWYIEGEQIDCKDNEEFLRIVKMKEFL
jgi:hypothetical protein